MAEESTTSSVNFTAAEGKFLLTAMTHLQGPINFDFEAIATELGLKDASVARARWNTIKRSKLSGDNAGDSTGAGVKKPTPKKKSKVGAEGADVEGGDEPGETLVNTPKKRGRKSKAEKAAQEAAKAELKGDEIKEEDDELDGGVAIDVEF